MKKTGNYIHNENEEINKELLKALIHAKKILVSMADRGYYPLECLEDKPEFLGEVGFRFMSKAIEKATT
tara:strand:- start:2165 stop:2371 length:207 start_codon:yes stop_codon:yes gene_type:complete